MKYSFIVLSLLLVFFGSSCHSEMDDDEYDYSVPLEEQMKNIELYSDNKFISFYNEAYNCLLPSVIMPRLEGHRGQTYYYDLLIKKGKQYVIDKSMTERLPDYVEFRHIGTEIDPIINSVQYHYKESFKLVITRDIVPEDIHSFICRLELLGYKYDGIELWFSVRD